MSDAPYDETKHPRGDDGKFTTKPAGEADVSLGVADEDYRDTEPGHYTGKPFHLSVQPQFWNNDYAQDAGPAETFDIAKRLHSMDEEQRAKLIEDLDTGSADLDDVYLEAAADGDVTDGYGPFYVSGDPDELREWCMDNAAWVEDGTTPHPTGGYASVRSSADVTNYFDADGRPHREDGPATETSDGSYTEWARHGQIHREDGPAVRSVMVTPAVTWVSEAWYQNNERHREDGPAVTQSDVDGNVEKEEWWSRGVVHREDGPALVDHRSGRSEYWVGGEHVATASTKVQAVRGWKVENGRPVRDGQQS